MVVAVRAGILTGGANNDISVELIETRSTFEHSHQPYKLERLGTKSV